jgi:hypothetical protein
MKHLYQLAHKDENAAPAGPQLQLLAIVYPFDCHEGAVAENLSYTSYCRCYNSEICCFAFVDFVTTTISLGQQKANDAATSQASETTTDSASESTLITENEANFNESTTLPTTIGIQGTTEWANESTLNTETEADFNETTTVPTTTVIEGTTESDCHILDANSSRLHGFESNGKQVTFSPCDNDTDEMPTNYLVFFVNPPTVRRETLQISSNINLNYAIVVNFCELAVRVRFS